MASSLVLNRTRKVPAEDSAAFGPIAERFRRAGDLERAVSLCRDGLKRFPDHVSARVTLGWSLLDLGKYDDARVELEQVLRRAPDNLAAIRGLAELHDRFEHTLNLPMDGPGQWPPPASDVDAIAETTIDARAAEVAGQSDTIQIEVEADARPVFLTNAGTELAAPATMAPAEMGVPLWTETPAAEAPVAEPVASRRMHEVVAEPALDLEALLAEAESLDLAAAAGSVEEPVTAVAQSLAETPILEEPTLDLTGEVDLAALMGLEQDPALVGMAGSHDAAVRVDAPIELEPVAARTAEAEPMVAEPVATVIELEPAPVMEVEEPQPLALVEPPVRAEFVGAESAEALDDEPAESGAAVVFLGPRSVVPDVEVAPAAMVIAEPSPAEVRAAAAARLESFLRRVQARRHQLMAESVA